jgi:DNA gyrase subunit A
VDDGKVSPGQDADAVADGARRLWLRWHERLHILEALLKSIDQFDAVTAVIRASESAAAARLALADMLKIDGEQVRAVVGMQVLKLAGHEHQQLADEYSKLTTEMADLESIVASSDLQRELAGTERGEYLARQIAQS